MAEYNPGAGGLRGLLIKPPIRRSRFAETTPLGFGPTVRQAGMVSCVTRISHGGPDS